MTLLRYEYDIPGLQAFTFGTLLSFLDVVLSMDTNHFHTPYSYMHSDT